jgi:N-acetylglucosaminyldiphosphoundecaprenol N-acetyl-beta-D-mannosaminyltransferase
MNPGRLEVLGVQFDRVDPRQALTAIAGLLETPGCKQVVTPNPEYVMRADRDPELKRILNAAALSVPDGIGIIWASRLLGQPLQGRVTGVGLLPEIARLCAARGSSLYLLGGRPGVAEMTAAILREQIPNLEIAGVSCNDPDPASDPRSIEAINSSSAEVLAVAYGWPGEYWIDKNREELTGVRVAIGVGGAFDFISGKIPRAPKLMRRLGLEWLFRLWLEPSRARRMMVLPRFGLKVLASRWRNRR